MIEIEGIEEPFEYKKPEKPQLYQAMWSHQSREGLCYIQDVRHAISNSDQYPFHPGFRDYRHIAEQDAQEKTICAVIDAVNRVPVYEDKTAEDLVSKSELIRWLEKRMEEYGNADEYKTMYMLTDIKNFQISRKEVQDERNEEA